MLEQIYSFFYTPLTFGFMFNAVVTAIALSFICSFLSCFLVLKGMALMGDAISHSVLLGVLLAVMLGLNVLVLAFITAMFCALGSGFLRTNSRLKSDAVIGVVFSSMFGLSLLLYTLFKPGIELHYLLFGNLLGINDTQMHQLVALSIVVLIVLILKIKDFVLYFFDTTQAKILNLNLTLIQYTFLSIFAATVTLAMQVVGVVFVLSLLAIPGLIGLLISKSFIRVLLIAISSSLFATMTGVYLSFYLDIATAPVIVTVQGVLFLIALLINRLRHAFLILGFFAKS